MFSAFIVHKIPPHLAKDEFERKLEALVDEALPLPIVQKNLVKVEMIIQNEIADDHVGNFGFPPREEIVLVVLHSETREHLVELFEDPEVRKTFEKGKEWGLHSSSSAFSADLTPKIDNPAPENAVHLICLYNVPSTVSSDAHDQSFHQFMDGFVDVPACRKHFVRSEVWQSNNLLDDHIRGFGYSPAGPTFIHHAKLTDWDSALEMLKDPAAHTSVLDAGNNGEYFDLKKNAYVFSFHVVTKIDKST
jgi:hypothetical protein